MITTRDQLIDSMANNSSRIIFDKASISSTAVGQFHSLWQATGQPGNGATPTSVVTCNDTTLGGLKYNQQVAPATSYLSIVEGLCSNNASTFEIHDRLMHQGGLSGTVITAQTVGLDISANLGVDNMTNRIGDSNYSDIQWWLEFYTATGATVANATVNVTYNDGSTGNLTAVALASTRRASFMQPLNYLIPSASSGLFIKAINTVTLSASTGTVGNFGVTATKYRAALYLPIANIRFTADWAGLGIPEVPNASCLFAVVLAGTTTTGTLRVTGKVTHG